MQTTNDWVYFQDEDFTLRLESLEEDLHLHCEVRKWNKTVLLKMYDVFATLVFEAKSSHFRRLVSVTPNPRFAELFGGTSINKFSFNDKEYEVIVWVLK